MTESLILDTSRSSYRTPSEKLSELNIFCDIC